MTDWTGGPEPEFSNELDDRPLRPEDPPPEPETA